MFSCACRLLYCGMGDAFAALVGKRFGRHKIRMRFADPHKSVEESLAMFVSSALTVLAVLMWRGGLSGAAYAVIPLAGAAAVTMVELITSGGMDTITCPTAALVSVAVAPEAALSLWLDRIGSLVVAVYLVWCGVKTIWEAAK